MNARCPVWVLLPFSLGMAGCAPSPPVAPASTARPAACRAAQLVFSLDGGNGRFDGMSHSGIALVLHNQGNTTCTLPARPEPILQDAAHRTLPSTAQPPADMPPEPAPPLNLAPGAQAEADMRWVSGDVYDHGPCLSPAFIVLPLGTGETVSAAFAGRLCGPGGRPPAYTLAPFRPAPSPP
jgi:hypothetical protein